MSAGRSRLTNARLPPLNFTRASVPIPAALPVRFLIDRSPSTLNAPSITARRRGMRNSRMLPSAVSEILTGLSGHDLLSSCSMPETNGRMSPLPTDPSRDTYNCPAHCLSAMSRGRSRVRSMSDPAVSTLTLASVSLALSILHIPDTERRESPPRSVPDMESIPT